jgi:hypothetical protein
VDLGAEVYLFLLTVTMEQHLDNRVFFSGKAFQDRTIAIDTLLPFSFANVTNEGTTWLMCKIDWATRLEHEYKKQKYVGPKNMESQTKEVSGLRIVFDGKMEDFLQAPNLTIIIGEDIFYLHSFVLW